MAALPNLVAGDTGTLLTITVQDQSGNTVDLTGCSVSIRYKLNSGTTVVDSMNVGSPPTNGVVTYQFGSGELVPGTMQFQIQVTLDSGAIVTSTNNLILKVLQKL